MWLAEFESAKGDFQPPFELSRLPRGILQQCRRNRPLLLSLGPLEAVRGRKR
jgi:hypothetical protein